MIEFKASSARDYFQADGIFYFRYFNTQPSMMRHQVFASGVAFRQINNYLFVKQADGHFFMFYLQGDNGVIHGPRCTEYREPGYNKPVEYCIDGTNWCKWNPLNEL